MLTGQLSRQQVSCGLKKGLSWTIGPFAVCLQSSISHLIAPLQLFYKFHPLLDHTSQRVGDFYLQLDQNRGVRRWFRPQVFLHGDTAPPLYPFPQDHAFPYFEWGLNFSIATQAQHYLMLHCGVLARDDRVLLMPAPPATGKSTLTAALTLRGWRFFTDEIALLRPTTGMVDPLPRPVALKNAGIDLIQAFEPTAIIGPRYDNTRKGSVAHLAIPQASVEQAHRPGKPAWVLFLRRQPGSRPICRQLSPEEAFLGLASNAFNYEIQGARGFCAIAHLVRTCHLLELTYDDLNRAVEAVATIVNDHPPLS